MRQAQTLNEAQLRRVIQYCRSRRHPTRDETIILTSFYAGLRAKEIAALTVGNVFDAAGAVREQFILSAEQSKVDLSRFRAAPGARLSHLSFEGDRAFPAQS